MYLPSLCSYCSKKWEYMKGIGTRYKPRSAISVRVARSGPRSSPRGPAGPAPKGRALAGHHSLGPRCLWGVVSSILAVSIACLTGLPGPIVVAGTHGVRHAVNGYSQKFFAVRTNARIARGSATRRHPQRIMRYRRVSAVEGTRRMPSINPIAKP